jgi:hypothetical protein
VTTPLAVSRKSIRGLRRFVWVKRRAQRRGKPLWERVGARLSRGGNLA